MALAQDPGRPKATMWHGPALHSPFASTGVRLKLKRQDPAKPKATMWHGPASHAPPDSLPLPPPQVKRQYLDDSKANKAKATMWHGPATFGLASTPTAIPMLKERQDPTGSRPKASMWHGPASNAPFELSSPITDVEKRATPTPLDMSPLAGLKPVPGLASPAAPLPVSPFEPRSNTAKSNGTVSAVSAASTATPDSSQRERFVEPFGI